MKSEYEAHIILSLAAARSQLRDVREAILSGHVGAADRYKLDMAIRNVGSALDKMKVAS